jgi:hypothetical protein
MKFTFMARGEQALSTFRVLLFALAIPAGAALAQEYVANSGEVGTQPADVIQYPSAPLLRPAPDFSEWTIIYSYPSNPAAKGATGSVAAPTPIPSTMQGLLLRPRTVVTTKTGKIMRVVTVNLAGITVEKWFFDGAQYTKPAGSAVWFGASNSERSDDRNAYFSAPLPASGFQDLDWINDENYAGTTQAGGAQYLVFVPGGLTPEEIKDPKAQKATLEHEPKVAYIDAATRLPVALRLPGEIRQFRFTDPSPSTVLTLPPDLAAQIRNFQAAVSRLLEPAGRPY